MPFAVDTRTAADTRHRSAREIVIHPYSSPVCGKCQDSVVHQRLPWYPTGVISPDAGEVGEGAVRRLITDSTRLLMGNTSTIFCAEYLDLKHRQRTQAPDPRNPLGACMDGPAYHRTSLFTLLGIPRFPSLTPSAHPRSAPLTY